METNIEKPMVTEAEVVRIFATIEEARNINDKLLDRVTLIKSSISENEWKLPSGPALIDGRWEMI